MDRLLLQTHHEAQGFWSGGSSLMGMQMFTVFQASVISQHFVFNDNNKGYNELTFGECSLTMVLSSSTVCCRDQTRRARFPSARTSKWEQKEIK